MKKGKAITLLSIISVIIALFIAMTFVRFPIGINDFNSVLGSIETDYDISGGSAYTFELEEENNEPVEDINEVLDTISYRLNALGYENFMVKAIRPAGEENADYSIRVEVKAPVDTYNEPDYATLDADMQVVAKYGQLEFFGGTEAEPSQDNKIFEDEKVISSVSTQYVKDGESGQYVVAITFTDEAYNFIKDKMGDGAYFFKVTLGGEVLQPFTGESALTDSSFGRTLYLTTVNETAAKQMELQISSGGLKYQYTTPKRVGDVTSPLGVNVELYCVILVSFIVLASIIALIVLYKGFGIVSSLSLILFILIELLMLIAVPGIRVSLGSVAGIVLSTILTVGGFMITARRISEEFQNGKTVKASFREGFNRSLYPIVNSTVICGVGALILFLLTSGQLKGLAITLGIGSVVSIISTLLFTRMFTNLILAVAKNKEALFNLKRKED